jgi:hypothetical protein
MAHSNQERNMSDNLNQERDDDGAADAIAATAVIAIAVLTAYVWLSGLPA